MGLYSRAKTSTGDKIHNDILLLCTRTRDKLYIHYLLNVWNTFEKLHSRTAICCAIALLVTDIEANIYSFTIATPVRNYIS